MLAITFSSLLYFCRSFILGLYTSNTEILEKAETAIWLINTNLWIDVFKGAFRGTSKALGIYKQVVQ